MIRFDNVHKKFGSTHAVNGLTLEIQTGEVFGLLGPNGAGKTTTVNMAVGLLTPDEGSIDINGLGSPVQREVRAKIGVAPQAPALYDELSAEENLQFFGKLQQLSGAQLKARVDELLAFVNLNDRRKDRVKTFSGGMKRRLNLAVALLHRPPVVFLDEPTAGVDPQSRNALFDYIENIRSDGSTIVYTTHYMEEAQRLCNRVGIIDHGKLLALGTVDELIAAHGGQSVLTAKRVDKEFSIQTDDPISELIKIREGGDLLSFKVESPNLEIVFLNLTGRKLRD